MLELPRHTHKLLALALISGFALRVFRLDFFSVWWDESYSFDLASRSLVEMTLVTGADIHPPLHYYLLHLWLPLAGSSEYALRFNALLFGMLLIPVAYQLGRRLLNPTLGLVTALLLAVAPFHVAYSQEARMYTLETLLAAISTYLTILMLQRAPELGSPPNVKHRLSHWALAALYALVTALALYADYFPVFVILLQNLFVLGWALLCYLRNTQETTHSESALDAGLPGLLPRRQALGLAKLWFLANLGAFLLYLPWAIVAYFQVTGYGFGKITTPPLPLLIAQTWSAYNLGQSAKVELVAPYLIINTLLLLLGLLLFWRSKLRSQNHGSGWSVLFLVSYLIVPFVIFVVALQFRPFFNPRYMLVATLPIYLLLGLAFMTIYQRWCVVTPLVVLSVLAGFAVSLNSYFFVPAYAKDDARSLMNFLAQNATSEDLILWQTRHPFYYYYKLPIHAYELETRTATTPAELTQLAQGHKRVFWVTWEHNDTDPWDFVNYLLQKTGKKGGDQDFTGYHVSWYRLPPNPVFTVGDLRPLQVNFDNEIALKGVALGAQDEAARARSGETFWITLQWQALNPTKGELKFFVHLRDQKGRVVSQTDRLLWNDARLRTPYWRVGDAPLSVATPRIPPGTPPGKYNVEVGVYSDEAGRPLGIVGGGAPLIVGSIEVERGPAPVAAEDLPMQRPVSQSFGPIELLGYSVGKTERQAGLPRLIAAQGDRLPLTLFWQATQTPERDLPIALRLLDATGQAFSESTALPVDGTYPTGRWREGEVVNDRRDYSIAPDVPEGDYRLALRIENSPDVALAYVKVKGQQRSFTVPEIRYPLQAKLGTAVELLGYDVNVPNAPAAKADQALATMAPGATLELTLYWRATRRMDKSYTVFTHLLDAQSQMRGQKDNPPQEGQSLTTSWIEGQVVTDRYKIPLSADAAPGLYQIEVGMYDAATGQRLPVEGYGDRILLGTVAVRR